MEYGTEQQMSKIINLRVLILLHTEWPKLYKILAILSAIYTGLKIPRNILLAQAYLHQYLKFLWKLNLS